MANEKRLIDANEAYELHSNYPMFARSCADLTDLRDILDEAKTVDAVEVVRCKDCKYMDSDGRCCAPHEIHAEEGYDFWVDEDDFCSYGERRTDNA